MRKILLSLFTFILISFNSYAWAENTIVDVTNGKEIRGIVTNSSASGYAKISWDNKTFDLHAVFSDLTDPQGDDFYEGWLVRKSPFAFISTGKLRKKDWKYHNIYTSSTDYSNYTEYVLTIEPNDWNAAPADHILEWMVKIVSSDPIMKKDHMMDTSDSMNMKKKAMMDRKSAIKEKIKSRIPNLSQKKIMIVLDRVKKLRMKLENLNISDEKKQSYNEILDVFVEILESDDIMN